MDGRNAIYLSAASAWEIAIKAGKGCLTLPEEPLRFVVKRMDEHRFLSRPIQAVHALCVFAPPPQHADLFDRLLVAQSQLESMPLLTRDAEIRRYEVKTAW